MVINSIVYAEKKMFYCKTSFLVFMMLLTGCFYSIAQYKLQINIRSLPSTHINEPVFIAGNFNDWNPGNEKYMLAQKNEINSILLTGLQKNVYQFKFTRGSWQKTETDASGKELENRIIQLESDTSINLMISGWKDDFPETKKQHTASSNVHILDTAFFIPQLSKTRRIWIYLPKGYDAGKKRYPVLYMHDGQNLFDEFTSAYGEWGVDECLDSLTEKGNPGCIVIGIDNGTDRVNEYNPYDHVEYGVGKGEKYIRFLVETLKPYVDEHYRTLTTKENTWIAGSSLAGLISYYAMLKYPDIYGKGGFFSPSFWIAPNIFALTDSVGNNLKGQYFFMAGELEGDSMINHVRIITDKLGENSSSFIYSITDPTGRHQESSWRKWFEEFYLWISGNGVSYQIKTRH